MGNHNETQSPDRRGSAAVPGSLPVTKCPHCGKCWRNIGRCNPKSGQFYNKFECGTKVWHDRMIKDERTHECYEHEISGLKHAMREALIPLAAFKISDARQPFSEMCHDLRVGLLLAHDYIYGALKAENAEASDRL